MENFLVAAAGVVIQETVSRTVSYVLGKRKEKASQGQHLEKVRNAVEEVEFALERTAKLPITDVSLLRARIKLKRDFMEAAAGLLSRNKKRQALQRGRGGGGRPGFIGLRKEEDESTSLMSCEEAERFQRLADSARNVLRDVESGCSLRRYMFFPSPLVRHLLEWRALRHENVQGSTRCTTYIWPGYSEERGVEAKLHQQYSDRERPEKRFSLVLVLRLSESTDIAGIATTCLELFSSRFKIVAESITRGLLTQLQLAGSLADSMPHSYAPPSAAFPAAHSQLYRPDPVCCKARSGHGRPCVNDVVSSELSQVFPEQVSLVHFSCCISPPQDDDVCTIIRRDQQRSPLTPLKLVVFFVPHHFDQKFFGAALEKESFAIETAGDIGRRIDGTSSIEVAESLFSNAISCFSCRPEVTAYNMSWFSKHGGACFRVEKPK